MNVFTTLTRAGRTGLFVFIFSLLNFQLMAGEIRLNTNKPEVRYTKGSQLSFTFRTNLPSVQFREVNTRAGVFTELFAEGYGWGNSVGDPKLPVYHKMIQLPLGAGFNIRITKVSYRDVDLAGYGILNPVIPAQAPVSKNTTDPGQLPFVYNQATYQLDQWLGGPLVTVTPAGILRSVDLGRLDIAPVQYNPVTNRLRVYESIEATVEFTHPDLAATQALEQRTWSPYFNNIYAQLPNYSPQNPDTLITGGPVTMVIVAPRMFHDSLQKLVRWKIRKGFHVIQGYTDDPGVGSTTTSIRNFLMNLYNNPPAGYAPPSFVLLVGDVTEIPTFTPSGHPSDLHYCEYTGDNIPEVYYGRFSASTAGQLQPYIDKSVEYEEYQIPDDAFLGEATMVAGADATNGPLYGNGQINYGTSTYFNSAHNILSHTYLQPEPPNGNYSQQIRQNVSDGVSFANYTAHGSEQGWADPQFVISQIPPLQNDHKYCLMVGNCCKTSNFGLDCFAEEVVRAAHKGAVGYIGCSDYSYWDEDYWWAIGFKTVTTNPAYDPNHLGAYDVTFHDHGESQDHWYVTLGQMITGGDLAVEESTSGIKQYYWETYCLMGDPSLSIYQFVPSQLNATYSNVLPVGATSLTVTTEPWAYVALTVNDTIILDARTSDATGIVNLSFSPLTATGNLSLTGTKQDRKPYFGTIQVIPGNQPWVILSSFTVDDSVGGNNDHDADYGEAIRLNVTVTNLGTVPCSNATGTLSTPDTNVLITENTECFGSIPAGGTVTAHDAFSVSIHTNVTDQHVVVFNLEISDGTHSWNSDLDLVLNAPSLAIGNYYILDPPPGGNNNGILDPGESATLKVRVINQGHAPVNNAVAHLSVLPGSAPYILVTDPNYYIGTLNVNSLVFSYTGIVSNGITPVGTNVGLNDILTAGSQGQYFAQKEIDVEIGDVPDYYMANGTVTTCSANFYDSGGPLSNYSDNESYTMTFYPGTSGAEVQAGFTQFDVEPQANCDYDWLKIYDGSSTSGTLLGTYCGTTSPGVVTSTTGALTFNFHSDYSDNYSGWSADLSCIGGPLTLVANAFPASVCLGSASQLVAVPSGGSGNYTYQWTPATWLDDPASRTPISTPLSDITYTVTVYDGSTSLTSGPVGLTVHPIPPAPTITENGDMLISDAAAGNQWYVNQALIPGATQQTYIPTVSGTYYTVVTDSVSGCPSDPSNSILYLMTGIETSAGQGLVTVYPNPFNDKFNINYTVTGNNFVRITLLDAFGKEVKVLAEHEGQPEGNYTLTCSPGSLNAGFYFVKVQTGSYSVIKKILLIK